MDEEGVAAWEGEGGQLGLAENQALLRVHFGLD
jgi:hypothetical protein